MNESLNNTLNLTLNDSFNETLNVSDEFIFSEFRSDIVNSSVEAFSFFEVFSYLILISLICYFTYRIFKESKIINSFIDSESLGSFNDSFRFYFYVFIIFLGFLILVLFNLLFPNNVMLQNISVWYFIFGFIIYFLFGWIGRAFLLYSVSLKFYEKSKFNLSKRLFLILNFLAIFLDFIVSTIILVFSSVGFVLYNVFILGLFLFFAFRNVSLKNLSKHIPYLTIILLLSLRFTSSFEVFVESEDGYKTFELALSFLTLCIYVYIFKKLIVWRKKFEK